MQVVVKADRHIAPGGRHRQLLMPLTRAVNHGEGVRPNPVDHAVVDELARVVQHAGIERLAGHQLFHVPRRGAFDHMAGGMDQ
jgi:butyrate kinase